MSAENNENAGLVSLKSQLKLQRIHNASNTLINLTDVLIDRMSNDETIKVDDDELNKINDELVKLQERIVKAVK